jgi:hypothetical protein
MDDVIIPRDADGGSATSYEALKARVHELKKTHKKVVANQTAVKEVRVLMCLGSAHFCVHGAFCRRP